MDLREVFRNYSQQLDDIKKLTVAGMIYKLRAVNTDSKLVFIDPVLLPNGSFEIGSYEKVNLYMTLHGAGATIFTNRIPYKTYWIDTWSSNHTRVPNRIQEYDSSLKRRETAIYDSVELETIINNIIRIAKSYIRTADLRKKRSDKHRKTLETRLNDTNTQ